MPESDKELKEYINKIIQEEKRKAILTYIQTVNVVFAIRPSWDPIEISKILYTVATGVPEPSQAKPL